MSCDNCGTSYNSEDEVYLEEYKGKYGKKLTRLIIECPYCGHSNYPPDGIDGPLRF